MRLLLARHGNTFEPDQTAVLIGAGQDLPLVSRGKEQARALALHLRSENLVPSVLITAELRRTKQFATELAAHLAVPNLTIKSDARLNELNYGRWSGLSSEELLRGADADAWKEWEQHSKWPSQAGFGSSPTQIIATIKSLVRGLLKEYAHSTILCVSSNGILRYFLSLVDGEMERRFAAGNFKMLTGAVSLIECFDHKFDLRFWNQQP